MAKPLFALLSKSWCLWEKDHDQHSSQTHLVDVPGRSLDAAISPLPSVISHTTSASAAKPVHLGAVCRRRFAKRGPASEVRPSARDETLSSTANPRRVALLLSRQTPLALAGFRHCYDKAPSSFPQGDIGLLLCLGTPSLPAAGSWTLELCSCAGAYAEDIEPARLRSRSIWEEPAGGASTSPPFRWAEGEGCPEIIKYCNEVGIIVEAACFLKESNKGFFHDFVNVFSSC